MNKAKRSAASRKAWRTRKRMKAARLEARAEALGNLVQAVDDRLTEIVEGRPHWPDYMRRALPLPEFGKWEK